MEIREVVMSIVSITVGIILIGSLLAPQAADVMEKLQDIDAGWAAMVGVTVIMVIISLILIAVLGFSSKKQ